MMQATVVRNIDKLSEQDQQFLLEVPVMITFLVSGADDKIEQAEYEWAQRLVEFRSQRNSPAMMDYYGMVEDEWDESFAKYERMLENLDDLDTRTHFFAEQLKSVNDVLTKLHPNLAQELYESYRSFARQVAEAAGGILGFGAISAEEHKWVTLPMISNPAKSA